MKLSDFVKALTDKLQELKEKNQIKHWDFWNNQIYNETVEKPFFMPAVFLELNQINWETSLGHTAIDETLFNQQGNVIFTLWLVFKTFVGGEKTFFETIIPIRDLIVYEFNNRIFADATVIRTDEEQDTNHDNVVYWKITFRADLIETFTDEDYENIIIEIVPQIEQPIDEPMIRTNNLNNH